jgi:hypothetical protein
MKSTAKVVTIWIVLLVTAVLLYSVLPRPDFESLSLCGL